MILLLSVCHCLVAVCGAYVNMDRFDIAAEVWIDRDVLCWEWYGECLLCHHRSRSARVVL